MPRLLPHPERAPSPQDKDAVSGLVQSRPPSPGHRPAHPAPVTATAEAEYGKDHLSPLPRWLASRLPPANIGRPHFPALPEYRSRDSFPQPLIVPRCTIQQRRFPYRLSVEQMRTHYLMQAQEGKPIGERSCELPSARRFCRFCPNATVLKWVDLSRIPCPKHPKKGYWG